MIDQSLKGRIFVNPQDNQFVQCVSPNTICPEAMQMGWPASVPNNWLCSRYVASHKIEHAKTDEKAKLRIEFKGERIIVYVLHESNDNDSFKQKAKSIEGWRYCRNDFGWYFPLDKAVEALNILHEGYETEPKLDKAIALIKQLQTVLSKSAW